jgi:hypothetical protein
MARVYILLLVFGLLGGVGFGAWKYYTDTQQRIQTLAENNAKLETALETSEASITALQAQAEQTAKLTVELQGKLQQAEQYGDNLRKRLRQLDLNADALANPADLEGRMNGATAKLWREIMGETGNDTGSKSPNPQWLQQPTTGAGDQNSNPGSADNSTDGSQTQTN